MNKSKLDKYDIEAEHEGIATKNSLKSHTMNFGKRIRILYRQGNDFFPTGEKHRMINRS